MTDLIAEVREILMNGSVSHEARVYAARVLIYRETKPRKNIPNPGYSQADPATGVFVAQTRADDTHPLTGERNPR